MDAIGLLRDYDPAALPGAGTGWLDGLRAGGARRFAGLGLPNRRVEEWRYTDLGALSAHPFAAACAGRAGTLPPPCLGGRRAVFVNGRFDAARSELSGPGAGVVALPLTEALARVPQLLEAHLGSIAALGRKHFVALNTAWLAEGFVLWVPDGAALEGGLELLFVGDGGEGRPAWHPRNLVVLGRGAEAAVVERHSGRGAYLANGVTEIALAPAARLAHYKLQDEADAAFHIAATEVRIAADAAYENFSLMAGGAVARNRIAVELAAPGASCRLNGAYLGRGACQLDTDMTIDHAAPDGSSDALYKGVLDGRARGVFQGRIVVRKGARKTQAHQTNRALLLSERAEIDAKPELEIYADDVQCGHGATAGALDEDALFYLRARGLPAAEARGLLIDAFVAEALATVAHDGVRDAFRRFAAGWRQGGAS